MTISCHLVRQNRSQSLLSRSLHDKVVDSPPLQASLKQKIQMVLERSTTKPVPGNNLTETKSVRVVSEYIGLCRARHVPIELLWMVLSSRRSVVGEPIQSGDCLIKRF